MKFDRIPVKRAKEILGYIEFEDKFYHFVDDFGITGVCWSQPTNISASYFIRLLTEGSSSRARGYGRGSSERDEYSNQLQPFYCTLLDHGAMWKMSDGTVICTAMPYGDKTQIINTFRQLLEEFELPDTVRLEFLSDEYRYRSNGDCMIAIYADSDNEGYIPGKTMEELEQKAISYSSSGRTRLSSTTAYVRNQYISEYAKRKANGTCQLCKQPAPFLTKEGIPFLEAHHVIPLAEGGTDSLENIVALCPNCHRKMHALSYEEDIEYLLEIARNKG